MNVRRLRAGDEPVLALLARDDADFDVDGRGGAQTPLPDAEARAFLADDHVLVLDRRGKAAPSSASCRVSSSAAAPPRPSSCSTRSACAPPPVAAASAARSMDAMTAWMRAHAVAEVWVLADNDDAVAFYRACGFAIPDGQATYLTRKASAAS